MRSFYFAKYKFQRDYCFKKQVRSAKNDFSRIDVKFNEI